MISWRRRNDGYRCTVFEFAYPLAFLALPLPFLVWWLLPPHREKVSALRIPFFDEVVAAVGIEAQSGATILRRRWLQRITAIVVWTLLVVGLAKPELIGEPIVRTEAARDIMLAIDLSGSMDYKDFPDESGAMLRRLAGVQRVVDKFVAERSDDRVGLIVFGDSAYLQLPFTRDLESARALVDLMAVGMAGPRTAIGDAIGLTIKTFESSELEDQLLILLTDGNDTASKMSPINAAAIAAENGITIYSIGVGDTEATGEDRVDFAALESVASRTGGAFFDATDETSLQQVYARIDELAVADVKTTEWRPRKSLLQWPAGAALIISLISYLLLLLGARRRRVSNAL
jgi:Ca-activated chloride channel family protein